MPNENKMMDMGRMKTKISSDKTISWQSPEFIQFDRSVWWYVILIVAGLGLMSVFYFMNNNYLGMGMVGLAVIVMIIIARQKPRIRKYILSTQSISINDKATALSEFKSYYITYVNNVADLHLERAKKISAPVSMYLENDKEQEIIDFIKKILPENVKINNTASDVFSNWFRF